MLNFGIEHMTKIKKSIIEKVIMTFAKIKNLYLNFAYKKLISRLAHCRIYHKKEILKFFISNRKCRNFSEKKFFLTFSFDKSIKILGPDTRIKIKKTNDDIYMITYIDHRLENKYDLKLKVNHYSDPYYAPGKPVFIKYRWSFPNFFVRVDFLDR